MQIEDHYGLALKLAHERFRVYEILPREDYEQEALLALVLAWNKFDSSREIRFSTFAFYRIKGALINAEQSWQKFHRKTRRVPLHTCLPKSLRARGMTEADINSLFELFEGEWFAAPARLVLLYGRSVIETAELCRYKVNTVHQAVSYFRRRLISELAS